MPKAPTRSWKRRRRTCLKLGCDQQFFPELYDEWYCSPEHRAQARQGADDLLVISTDERIRMNAQLARVEPTRGRRGIKFGNGYKNRTRRRRPMKPR